MYMKLTQFFGTIEKQKNVRGTDPVIVKKAQ